MTYINAVAFIILLAINISAFGLVWIDKARSYKGHDRLPEIYFFTAAVFLGSLGVYLAMLMLRHKIRKWYFALGIPFLLIQNLILIIFLYNRINHWLSF